MKYSSKTTALSVGLAVAMGLGMSANVALAADNSGASEDHSSTMGKAVSDTWITTKVKTELATTDGVDSTDISVQTVDGKVTLTGVLPSETQIKKAKAVTKSVEGVKEVDASALKAKD
ncbi:MAG: BON domain-containing protein [Sinobacteraceae bacterium]|nr:BON domain-containing protein [Nevskiaceae bacterium]